MKPKKISSLSTGLLFAGAVLMVIVLFVPLWKIDLVAPQYPEGLALVIYPSGLHGNVDIINGLNHYIGMKTLHTGDFKEFIILPYLIGFFAFLLLIAAIIRKKAFLIFVTILFICFGVIAMFDFWRWEYNYGHHLDPNAAIIVPGMAYQPPLIGYKQLLNFSAWSFPAIGGWLFAATGLLLLISVFIEQRFAKRRSKVPAIASVASIALVMLSSCNSGPEPIHPGKDNCTYCGMTLSDPRFGAELITKKGKVYKFDDIHCLQAYLMEAVQTVGENPTIYFVDFTGDHTLIKSPGSMLLKSDRLHSPMGGNIAAFRDSDSLRTVQKVYGGQSLSWKEVYQK